MKSANPFTRGMDASRARARETSLLPPIPGLRRQDPEHRYVLDRPDQPLHWFPVSITGVLALGKSAYAMERIEATRAIWEPRGNTCHLALECFLQGRLEELQALAAGDYADWITPLITHPRWDEVRVIASERPTCCLRRNVSGTYDCGFVERSTGLRVLVDLKSLAASRLKWRQVGTKDWAELADLPATAAAARINAGIIQWRAAQATQWNDLITVADAPWPEGANVELRVSKPSTYSTAAQLGGYMALEATHGVHYDAGQTIWARPGQTTFSLLYSRAECLHAWALAWARWLHSRNAQAQRSEPERIQL